MRCLNCSGQYVTIKGDLEMSDKILGDYIVPNTEYERCEGCGEKLFSPITLSDIEKAEMTRKNELMLRKPLGDFISAVEVGKVLNCSRQAVHKHKRIGRGFIHFIKYDGTYHYHKKSVLLYKETGDGRFQLEKPKSKIISFSDIHAVKQKEASEKIGETAGDSSIYDNQLFEKNTNKEIRLEG